MLKEMLMSNALLGESGGGGGGSGLTTATVQLVPNGIQTWVSYCTIESNGLAVKNTDTLSDSSFLVTCYNGVSRMNVDAYGDGYVEVSGDIAIYSYELSSTILEVYGDGTITIIAYS